jgi:CheY-like chemotaxis protein/CRP-like cAMP-binding protein
MKNILLIEDNTEMRENTAEILELANYNVFTAKNGKEGVEIAQKEKPDLIICDIMMPVLDGYGVLHLLSKSPETENIPFIFLTAKAERSDFRKGMEMGADDYITKPFDDIELLNAIESRLRKSEFFKKQFSRNIEGLNEFIGGVHGPDVLQKLSTDKNVSKYKKKETIYKEGTFPKGIYFVTKGKVKTFKTHELGKEFITSLYKDGDFFGYLDLLEDSKYTETAEALDETEVCFIPKEEFFGLIFNNALVSKKFMKILSDNLAEKEDQMVKLAYNSVRKRVADALVNLFNRYKKENEPIFSINISREDLANLAGTATETTIRTLSDFKDEKIIDIKGGLITFLNHEKLQQMRN